MKITVITSPFLELPPIAIGAVEKLFYLLAGEWVDRGHHVAFVCCGGGNDERMEFIRLKKYRRTGSTKKDLVWDFFYSVKALWKCPKTDILLCNTFWAPALAPLFRWKYRRLAYGVHRYPKWQFWLYPFVHAFICVSTAVADELRRQMRVLSRRVYVINNPVDTAVFRRTDVARHSDRFTIVYAGRIHPEKGLDFLFSAAELLCRQIGDVKVRLKMIGAVAREKGGGGLVYAEKLAHLAPRVDVEWCGEITEPRELANEMCGDCFAYPSVAGRGEAFGVAPLEAMALGLPTVLSDLKCFSDYAVPGVNVIQVSLRKDAVAVLEEALLYVWSSPVSVSQMAENAAETALQFSKMKIAEQYTACFTRMLEGRIGLDCRSAHP